MDLAIAGGIVLVAIAFAIVGWIALRKATARARDVDRSVAEARAELDALVARAIEETGASEPRDMGKAIKHAMAAADGRADGKRVSTKVKEALS